MTNAYETMKKAELIELLKQRDEEIATLKAGKSHGPSPKWEKVVSTYDEATEVAKGLLAKAAASGKKVLPRVQRCEGGFKVWFA